MCGQCYVVMPPLQNCPNSDLLDQQDLLKKKKKKRKSTWLRCRSRFQNIPEESFKSQTPCVQFMVLKDVRGQQHCTMAVSFCSAKGIGINSCITLTVGGDRASYWPVCVSSACLSACANEGQHDLALGPRRVPASSSLVLF